MTTLYFKDAMQLVIWYQVG